MWVAPSPHNVLILKQDKHAIKSEPGTSVDEMVFLALLGSVLTRAVQKRPSREDAL